MSTDNKGPFLQAALLCERALREKDNVLSIIRIVDRWHVRTPPRAPEDTLPAFAFPVTGVIAFKSGNFKGKKTLVLMMNAPDGTSSELGGVPVLFEGDERGVNVIMNLNIQAQIEGLYWIDVLLDDDLQTRIPFRVIYEYIVASSTAEQIQP